MVSLEATAPLATFLIPSGGGSAGHIDRCASLVWARDAIAADEVSHPPRRFARPDLRAVVQNVEAKGHALMSDTRQSDWTKPAAMAIPKGGYSKDKVEQGRYGPIFPKTSRLLRLFDSR